jgi:signal transduction histidine kinase
MPHLPAEVAHKIDKQVKRLETIISDLLDISRIQAGRLNLTFKRSSLIGIIQDSLDSIPNEGNTIKAEMPEDDISVMVDRQKMSQVLTNILFNAVKYSPPKSEIKLTAIRIGDDIKISIADQGMGIPKESLDKIFDQFYRVPGSANIQGTGLGLYIAREIVDGHWGKIWAESEPGKGSVFHITFPIERMKME